MLRNYNNSDESIDIAAHALVHLADEEGLMSLFSKQITHLDFVEGEGAVGQRLQQRIVHIFVLDLEGSHAMKMGTGHYVQDACDPSAQTYEHNTLCAFYCQAQSMVFIPSFEERAAAYASKAVAAAATAKLSVKASAVNDDDYNEMQDFASMLELWKFLEVCLTGPLWTSKRGNRLK